MKTHYLLFTLALFATTLMAGVVTGPTITTVGCQAVYSVKDPPNTPYVWCISWSVDGHSNWRGNADTPSLTWTFPDKAPHFQFWIETTDGTLASNVLEVYPSNVAVGNSSLPTPQSDSVPAWHDPRDQSVPQITKDAVANVQPAAVNLAPLPALPGPEAAHAGQPPPFDDADQLKAMLAEGMILVAPNADHLIDAEAEANMLTALGADTNPFKNRYRPPSTTSDEVVTLGAIIIGPHSTVFFNDTLYNVGDTFLGMKVRAISARFIWLQHGKLLLQIPTDVEKITVRLPKS